MRTIWVESTVITIHGFLAYTAYVFELDLITAKMCYIHDEVVLGFIYKFCHTDTIPHDTIACSLSHPVGFLILGTRPQTPKFLNRIRWFEDTFKLGSDLCRHPSFEVSAPRFPALLCYTMDMQKRILNKWVIYGRVSGFALGFNVDKYAITIDLGFWYIGVEY